MLIGSIGAAPLIVIFELLRINDSRRPRHCRFSAWPLIVDDLGRCVERPNVAEPGNTRSPRTPRSLVESRTSVFDPMPTFREPQWQRPLFNIQRPFAYAESPAACQPYRPLAVGTATKSSQRPSPFAPWEMTFLALTGQRRGQSGAGITDYLSVGLP